MKIALDSNYTVTFLSVHSIPFLYPLSPLPQSPLKKKAAASSKAGAQDDLLLLFDDGLSNASSMAQHSAPLMPSMDHMLTPMTAALDINGGGGGVSYGKKYTVRGAIIKSPILTVMVS